MTINLISDVHATLDRSNDFSVLYAEKQKLSRDDCKLLIDALVEFAHSSKLNKAFSHVATEDEKMIYRFIPTNYVEYVRLVDNVVENFSSLDLLSINCKLALIDELDAISHWHWLMSESKNCNPSIVIADIINYVKKTMTTFDPAKLEPADYLIVAGDIGIQPTEDKILADIKNKTIGKFKDVFYIPGNHSHWWRKIPMIAEDKPLDADFSHDMLEREVEDNWLFLGCTLWSPIPERARWRISRCMNDYRYIPNFNVDECNKRFKMQSEWLKSRVEANKDKKVIIFTHHQPFAKCIEHDYKHNEDVAEAYADMRDSLADINKNGNIKIWCCGHTHMPFDEVVHGIRVVRNPIGYSDFYLYAYGESECDPRNWYNKVIDLGN